MTAPLELARLGAGGIAARVASGEISAVEVAEAFLAWIEECDPRIRAFLTVTPDRALAQARRIDEMRSRGEPPGPLAGVPISIKDVLCTEGIPTTCASKILDGWIPPYTATAVERALAAGAVPLGKTNMDEFAMGSSTENSAFGPTRNPWDETRVPGGSSGGSAASVAALEAVLSLGSDTGGSIRQPASFCGVVGLKPTYGRVSRYGLVAFASSLDQVGPFALTVRDAALLYDCISGHDPRDSTSIPPEAAASVVAAGPESDGAVSGTRRDHSGSGREDGGGTAVAGTMSMTVRGDDRFSALDAVERAEAAGERPLSGYAVGVVRELSGDAVEASVADTFRKACDRLTELGAAVEEVSLPSFRYALSAYYLIAPAEASSNLARYDGVRYGLRVDAEDATSMMARTRSQGFGAEVKRRIMLGTYALSAGYYEAFYGTALKVRTLVARDFASAFERFHILASPTSPTTAFRLGEKVADPLSMYLSDLCTIPANLAGIPAVSIPVGLDEEGLPIGMQLMAPVLCEPRLLAVAHLLERATGIDALPPVVVDLG